MIKPPLQNPLVEDCGPASWLEREEVAAKQEPGPRQRSGGVRVPGDRSKRIDVLSRYRS